MDPALTILLSYAGVTKSCSSIWDNKCVVAVQVILQHTFKQATKWTLVMWLSFVELNERTAAWKIEGRLCPHKCWGSDYTWSTYVRSLAYAWVCSSVLRLFLGHGQSQGEVFGLDVASWARTTTNFFHCAWKWEWQNWYQHGFLGSSSSLALTLTRVLVALCHRSVPFGPTHLTFPWCIIRTKFFYHLQSIFTWPDCSVFRGTSER